MKKILLILVAIGVITLIALYAYRQYSVTQMFKNPPVLGGDRDTHGCIGSAGYSWCEAKNKCLRIWEESCEQDIADETADWEIYKNENVGFELKFPKTWEGYRVTEGSYPTYSYTGFSFHGEKRQPFEIFKIVQYNKQQWEEVKNIPALKMLHQSGEFTFACDGCCEEGGDFRGGGQFDEFQMERCKEVPQIVKTFRYTK